MRAHHDLIGETHNNRLVLSSAPTIVRIYQHKTRSKDARNTGKTYPTKCAFRMWNVRCLSCGAVKTIDSQRIKKGGCAPCSNSLLRMPGKETTFVRCRVSWKRAAIKRGYDWELSDKDVLKLMYSPCHYCGDPGGNSTSRRGHPPVYYNGIDRKDNEKDYTIDNVVACCGTCNHAKGTMGYLTFLEWLEKITAYRRGARV